jgi:hypothetical protein
MAEDKAALVAELDQARDHLWKILDALDPATVIYPGWTKREFYAHIAGWEACVFEFFQSHAHGQPLKTYPYDNLKNLDEANAHFVAERQSGTTENLKLECDIYRYAIKRMMNDIPDFSTVIQFPWGRLTLAQFIHDAATHEDEHAADILKLAPH